MCRQALLCAPTHDHPNDALNVPHVTGDADVNGKAQGFRFKLGPPRECSVGHRFTEERRADGVRGGTSAREIQVMVADGAD